MPETLEWMKKAVVQSHNGILYISEDVKPSAMCSNIHVSSKRNMSRRDQTQKNTCYPSPFL